MEIKDLDQDLFKAAMRQLVASVCVITTKTSTGERFGLTVTAVCSVTASPPTLLCCINRNNGSYESFRESGIFAVNILSVGEKEIANRFASQLGPKERFQEGQWREAVTGSPILETSAVSFDCQLSEVIEAGSHSIFLGKIVDAVVTDPRSNTLLYGAGNYGQFSPK